MQSNPRILVNLLVISVKIPVNLLVKLTKLGGARPGAPPQEGGAVRRPGRRHGGHKVCCSSPTYSPDSLANSLADSLANITNSKCIIPTFTDFYRFLPMFSDFLASVVHQVCFFTRLVLPSVSFTGQPTPLTSVFFWIFTDSYRFFGLSCENRVWYG